jgi:hypothetical protein
LAADGVGSTSIKQEPRPMSLIVSAQADYKETEIPVAKLTLARQIGRLVVSLVVREELPTA